MRMYYYHMHHIYIDPEALDRPTISSQDFLFTRFLGGKP